MIQRLGPIHHFQCLTNCVSTLNLFIYKQIKSFAEEWTENQEEKPQIYELLQAIDRSAELLNLTYKEISGSFIECIFITFYIIIFFFYCVCV
jgi:hypothetical protein